MNSDGIDKRTLQKGINLKLKIIETGTNGKVKQSLRYSNYFSALQFGTIIPSISDSSKSAAT